MSTSTKRTTGKNNKKRFNDDQVKTLETTFETESRPELHLKQHLAKKLGLQPRQVAIWFQNKRARSKSKRIEGEYSVLKSNYDKLASQLEALRKENQTVLIQMQGLRNMTDKRDVKENKNENRITLATSENPRFALDYIRSHELCMPSSCSDENRKADYLELETDVLNMARIVEGCSLASPENGCSFESLSFLDNAGSSGSQWWDF